MPVPAVQCLGVHYRSIAMSQLIVMLLCRIDVLGKENSSLIEKVLLCDWFSFAYLFFSVCLDASNIGPSVLSLWISVEARCLVVQAISITGQPECVTSACREILVVMQQEAATGNRGSVPCEHHVPVFSHKPNF